MADRTIQVDRVGKDVADTVFMSDQPHPKGYILTNSMRVRRALWAYQWAMARKASWTSGDFVMLPSNSVVLAALREWEGTPDE